MNIKLLSFFLSGLILGSGATWLAVGPTTDSSKTNDSRTQKLENVDAFYGGLLPLGWSRAASGEPPVVSDLTKLSIENAYLLAEPADSQICFTASCDLPKILIHMVSSKSAAEFLKSNKNKAYQTEGSGFITGNEWKEVQLDGRAVSYLVDNTESKYQGQQTYFLFGNKDLESGTSNDAVAFIVTVTREFSPEILSFLESIDFEKLPTTGMM